MIKMKKTMTKAVVCAVIVAAAGWMAGGRTRLSAATHLFTTAGAAAPVEIKIDNYSFTPADITVDAGTTVTWVNRDDVPHTVRNNDGTLKSKALDTDEKFSMTFDKPGTYEYFCSVHPKMTGRVVVK
jgi:amicyanin